MNTSRYLGALPIALALLCLGGRTQPPPGQIPIGDQKAFHGAFNR